MAWALIIQVLFIQVGTGNTFNNVEATTGILISNIERSKWSCRNKLLSTPQLYAQALRVLKAGFYYVLAKFFFKLIMEFHPAS